MLRGLIKNAFAMAFDTAGSERLLNFAGGANEPPVVVGYHQVVPEFHQDWRFGITAMQISCEMLERHLDWLGSRYEFVSLDEVGSHFETGEPFRKPVASVTFDDGYRDVYLNAFPILKRKGIPAAVFVVTDIVGTDTPPLHDRLYSALVAGFQHWTSPAEALSEKLARIHVSEASRKRILSGVPNAFATMRNISELLRQAEIESLVSSVEFTLPGSMPALDEARPLTWEMIEEMNAAGITIGSHTKSHVLLTLENSDRVYEEIGESKNVLDRRLGVSTRHFAYPDGRFDAKTAYAVAASGYRFGFTTCKHQLASYPLMSIPRRMLWENSCKDTFGQFSPSVMKCHVHGLFDWISGCNRMHGPLVDAPHGLWREPEGEKRPSWDRGWDA